MAIERNKIRNPYGKKIWSPFHLDCSNRGYSCYPIDGNIWQLLAPVYGESKRKQVLCQWIYCDGRLVDFIFNKAWEWSRSEILTHDPEHLGKTWCEMCEHHCFEISPSDNLLHRRSPTRRVWIPLGNPRNKKRWLFQPRLVEVGRSAAKDFWGLGGRGFGWKSHGNSFQLYRIHSQMVFNDFFSRNSLKNFQFINLWFPLMMMFQPISFPSLCSHLCYSTAEKICMALSGF